MKEPLFNMLRHVFREIKAVLSGFTFLLFILFHLLTSLLKKNG